MTQAPTRPAAPDGSPTWHDREVTDAFVELHSQATGLTTDDAADRIARYGSNRIPSHGGPAWPVVLLRQFTSPLIYALLASAAVALALREVVNAVVVLAVVALNATIGFVQEYRAGRAIGALAEMVSEPSRVLRGGAWATVDSETLVPGDVVAVAPGDRVAADLRLVEGHGLRADESALTGESLPVTKQVHPVPASTTLAERTSVLHAGTLVSAGTGQGLVVETGEHTELGRISGLIGSTEQRPTPLTRSIARLGTNVTRAIGVVTVVLLGVALLRGYPLADAALAAITLAVAAIPEGLPAIVTIALAIGVRRMAARQTIVRELPAVETLGATSVVCTDKTGTLTRNEMVVRRAWTPTDEVELEGVGYSETGRLTRSGEPVDLSPAVRELLVCAVLANESHVSGTAGEREVSGDPTDAALLVAADRAHLSRDELTAREQVELVPFDAERRFMAAAYRGGDGAVTTYAKGAPEALLVLCPAPVRAEARTVLDRYTREGMRVLAFVSHPGPDTDVAGWSGSVELLGLVAMVDPPRVGVADSIAACQTAGIEVKMITGDHPGTAAAIGRELGITGAEPALTGPEIADLDDAGLRERAGRTGVFARVAPEHKLRLVRALQADGAIVAMTGDGVNDAPALRQADVGVAMGLAGTAAAKEAADIVLGDDDFATIRSAVEEGRRVYDNLVKALAFALPTNVGEGLVIVVAILAFPVIGGEPILPIQPVQVLWLNLVATVTLALPLAFEAKERGLMTKAPRNPDAPLLSRFVVFRTIYVGVLMCAIAVALFLASLSRQGQELTGSVPPSADALAGAQTLAVTAMMFFQVFYLVSCRTIEQPLHSIGWLSNPYVYAGIAAVVVLQVGFVELPFMNHVFATSGLSLKEWALAAAAGAVVLPVVSLEKMLRRR